MCLLLVNKLIYLTTEQVAVKLPGSYPSKPVAKNVEVSPEQNGKDTPVPKSTNDESKEEESDRKEEKDAIANNNEELKDEDEDETEEPDVYTFNCFSFC